MIVSAPSSYLTDRGFSAETIEACGWRVDRLTDEDTDKFPASAVGCLVWRIPYSARPGRDEFVRVRFIEPEDAARWHRYRQPVDVDLDIFDPFGWIARTPRSLLLIEGEANCAAVHQAVPTQPVAGLPGISSLKPELAARLGEIETVVLWLDRDESDPKKANLAARARDRAAARLNDAGVQTVKVVGATGGKDANDLLMELGAEGMARRIRALARDLETLPKPEPAPAPMPRPRVSPRSIFATDRDRARDELHEIPAEEYLTRLAGTEFRNGKGLCPFHSERTASLHAGPQGAHLFHCFGCGASGDIFTAAGLLWDIDPKGDGFKELLDLLAAEFLGWCPA
ncbi:MAG: primase [Thermoleophilaceae bacterium]|jgi:hypothetical protein|nr:primase [Thermoleophilaceae bacterium]